MRVRALDEAKAELAWAIGYGELTHKSRGQRLLRDYINVIDWATRFPHSGSPIMKLDSPYEVRGFLLGKFDFTTIIVVLPDELVVVALTHHSQEPGYWRERLKSL